MSATVTTSDRATGFGATERRDNWWIGPLATALGLILGLLVDNRQKLQLATWVMVLPLLIPIFLSTMGNLFGPTVNTIINWIPTVALSRLIRASTIETITWSQVGPELLVMIGTALIAGAASAWIMRRQES